MKTDVWIIFFVVLLGCSKRKIDIKVPVKEHEARMTDVVTPVDAFSVVSNASELNFLIKCDKDVLLKYYQENLEIYGWKKVVEFYKQNYLLIYEKPNKFLSILIIPNKNNGTLKVLVYIQTKVND